MNTDKKTLLSRKISLEKLLTEQEITIYFYKKKVTDALECKQATLDLLKNIEDELREIDDNKTIA